MLKAEMVSGGDDSFCFPVSNRAIPPPPSPLPRSIINSFSFLLAVSFSFLRVFKIEILRVHDSICKKRRDNNKMISKMISYKSKTCQKQN